jgi:hypothetical protein
MFTEPLTAISTKTNSVAFSPTRAIPTERPPHFGEIYCQLLRIGGCRMVSAAVPTAVNLSCLDRSRYFFFQVALHLSSPGLSGPLSKLTDTQKSGSAKNRTRNLWVCSQEV